MSQRLHRWSVVAVSLIALLVLAPMSRGQVLKQVPDNAMVVIKVSNLQATSGKVAAFAQQLGIAMMVPPLADPLAWAMEQTSLSKGIDKDGELAIVFLDPKSRGAERRGEPPIIALIPVSDYKEFLANFGESKAEGDVSQVTLPNTGDEKAYVAKWGEYAALSPYKSMVAKKSETSLAAAGLTAKEMESKDAVIYANFKTIRTLVLPEIKRNRTSIVNEITRGMARQKEAQRFTPVLKTAVNQMINIAEGFFTNTDAATFGISFSEGGLKTTAVCEFVPGSYPAQMVAKIQNTEGSMLTGLPKSNYLFYGGMNFNNAFTQAWDDATAPITKELTALGDDMKPVATYMDAVKRMLASTDSMTFGMVAPTGMIGQESLFQGVSIGTGDAKAIAAAQKDVFETQGEITKLTTGQGIQTKTTYTANAKTIDGVAFDQFQTEFSAAGAKSPEHMQIANMMTMMYGPNGMNAYGGVVDEKHFAGVMGGNDDLMKATVAAIKANQDNLSTLPQVAAVSGNLPKNHFFVWYVPVDAMISTGVTYAKQFGMPINLAMPPNLPPIGVAGATEGNAVRVDGYIPSQLVQSLVAAGMQMFMAMQGGGAQPGGPGGL